MKRLLSAVLALLIALSLSAAGAEPALFCIRGEGGGTCWLMGTIHVGTAEDGEALGGALEALEGCTLLLTEVEMDSLEEGSADLLLQSARYFLPLWEKLEDRLGGEMFDRLADYTGLSRLLLQRFSPLWVSAYLEALSAAQAGLDAQYGTENLLWARAKEMGIENAGMEEIADQMDAALSFSDAYLKASIAQYLEDPEGMRDEIAYLHGMWLSGDGEGLTAYVTALGNAQDADGRDAYEALYRERNTVFAGRIAREIGTGGTVMAAVGCGHLWGEDGVLRLLEEMGYAPERIR